MSEENYKKEAVILLFEHLPPLAKALNNLSQLISEKNTSQSELSFAIIHEEDPKFSTEIHNNVKAAVASLEILVAKVGSKVAEFSAIEGEELKNKKEEVRFYLNFQIKVLVPNIEALTMLFKWVSGNEDEEFDLEKIITLFFEGSRNLGSIVETLTEENIEYD